MSARVFVYRCSARVPRVVENYERARALSHRRASPTPLHALHSHVVRESRRIYSQIFIYDIPDKYKISSSRFSRSRRRRRPALPLDLLAKRWDCDCSPHSGLYPSPQGVGGLTSGRQGGWRIFTSSPHGETLTQVPRVMPSSTSSSFFICFVGFVDA